jgi:S-adenosylmethionine decarboxylase
METHPFDAAEKLLELELRRGSPSLRALGHESWVEIVEAAFGGILESREGRLVDAYVLSESSLFVRSRSMSLLTCGRTDLGRAFEALVARVGSAAIAGVRLSRERDRFPAAARTTFDEDVARIARELDGETLESSHEDAKLCSFEVGCLSSSLDFRIFCAGLGAEAKRAFLDARGEIPERLAGLVGSTSPELTQLHQFEPSGTSMNFVVGEDVFCVHVSPEPSADVASVEASSKDARVRLALLAEAERVFRPEQISVTLDGRRLVSAAEARERLLLDENRSGDARVM